MKKTKLEAIKSMDLDKRLFLANQTADEETLCILATDTREEVRQFVALNENTPAKALSDLARDKSWRVRSAVGINKNTKAETLAMLASDKEWRVRCAVAGNKNAPIEALEALSIDNNKLVSETAEEALKECKEKNKASMKI